MALDARTRDNNWVPSADWAVVVQRANLLRDLRSFFDSREFVEIETPVLSHDTVVDRHLDPMSVHSAHSVSQAPVSQAPDSQAPTWLQTSPEFGMKRAVAHYGKSVYQITRAFRKSETGRLHNPEFTILEWYQTPANYSDGMHLLSQLAESMLDRGPAKQVSYEDAFLSHTSLNPHSSSISELKRFARPPRQPGATGPQPPDFGDDRDGWLDWLLSEKIQPELGTSQPLILYDYPATQAALAKIAPGPLAVAQRFELYVDGIELANGYHELDDAKALAQRTSEQNRLRQSDGSQPLPESSRLVDALASGFPPCAGVALGVDRLLMVKFGAERIQDVLTFPWERA